MIFGVGGRITILTNRNSAVSRMHEPIQLPPQIQIPPQELYGTFGWQGDDLTRLTPGISRPNPIAWYVCTGRLLYINLGNYLYNTPSGCADETIHYYNAATTNNK